MRKIEAIVAGVSGNTRLQAKYKPGKLGSTSYQVTENKALIKTCTPSGSAPPFFTCTWQHVTQSLAHCCSWLPSLFRCQSHSVSLFFRGAVRNGDRVKTVTPPWQLPPAVYALVHFWLWMSGTQLVVTQSQRNFDCGTGFKTIIMPAVENVWCSFELFVRFMHAGFNDKRWLALSPCTEKVAGLTPQGLEAFLCVVFTLWRNIWTTNLKHIKMHCNNNVTWLLI